MNDSPGNRRPAPWSPQGAMGYGGRKEHTVGTALEHALFRMRRRGDALETVGAPRWNGRWKLESPLLERAA